MTVRARDDGIHKENSVFQTQQSCCTQELHPQDTHKLKQDQSQDGGRQSATLNQENISK